MKKNLARHWSIAAITIVVFAFFARLFFPPSIFITPDYGRSDLLHFNIPVKTILSHSLKEGKLPLWEPNIGQGFPIFEEGQVGLFYIPNLLLFGLLPFWLAFNLGYVVTFLLSCFGTYLLARSFGLNQASSYLAAITYSFSPIFTLHIHHYNLIQTAALVPWFLWLANSFFATKRLIYLTLIPPVLSQQIFIGFPQITVYTLLALGLFFIFNAQTQIRSLRIKLKAASLLIFFVVLGLLIASPQIIATQRLSDQAKRFEKVNIQNLLTEFPLKPKNLLTVLDPFILGKPQLGTYPQWQRGSWSVFWESNLYFGIIQLALVGIIIINLLVKKFKIRNTRTSLFLVFFLLLFIALALGSSSPLHPLFSIPPFSFFRVPARFLLFTFLAAGLLAAIALNLAFGKRVRLLPRLLLFLIIAGATVDIFRVWYSYNPVGTKDKWLEKPQLATSINPQERIITLQQSKIWNNTFTKEGWQNRKEDFYFYRNFIGQNSNILYGLNQTFAYGGMVPRRTGLIERLITEGITTVDNQINISPQSQKLLNLTSTKYLITPQRIDSQNWQEINRQTRNDVTIFLYENLQVMPKAYTTWDYKIATTLSKFSQTLKEENYDPRTTVILEAEPNFQPSGETQSGRVFITQYQNTKVSLLTDLKSDSIVVLSDSFYPGWQAQVDGRQTKIMAANINSRAVVVPAGQHQIEFFYSPERFKFWLGISFFFLLCSLVIFVRFRKSVL